MHTHSCVPKLEFQNSRGNHHISRQSMISAANAALRCACGVGLSAFQFQTGIYYSHKGIKEIVNKVYVHWCKRQRYESHTFNIFTSGFFLHLPLQGHGNERDLNLFPAMQPTRRDDPRTESRLKKTDIRTSAHIQNVTLGIMNLRSLQNATTYVHQLTYRM